LPLPLSPVRRAQRDAFAAWLPGWLARAGDVIGQPLAHVR